MSSHYQTGDADTRPWGNWRVTEANPTYVVKRIEVNKGARLSLQYHNHRSEHWIITEGCGIATVGHDEIRVEQGSHIHIPCGTKHRIANDGDQPLVFVEVQLGELLDEADIIRLSDDYSR